MAFLVAGLTGTHHQKQKSTHCQPLLLLSLRMLILTLSFSFFVLQLPNPHFMLHSALVVSLIKLFRQMFIEDPLNCR
jgi:hypothetical protein